MSTRKCRNFGNDVAEIRRMSAWFRAVADDAGVDAKTAWAAELCLNEAAANIILHGCDDNDAHTITIEVEAAERMCQLTIADDGRPFDPLDVPVRAPVSSLEDCQVGGWGIPLLRTYASDMRYRRDASQNVLVLTFESPSA